MNDYCEKIFKETMQMPNCTYDIFEESYILKIIFNGKIFMNLAI